MTLYVLRRPPYALVAGVVTKTRPGKSTSGIPVTNVTIEGTVYNKELHAGELVKKTIEFWGNRASCADKVDVGSVISIYIKEAEDRAIGYAIKKGGIWSFPAEFKSLSDKTTNEMLSLFNDLRVGGIVDDLNAQDVSEVRKTIETLKRSDNIKAERLAHILADNIESEVNVIISTASAVDKYGDTTRISLPVATKNGLVYHKVSFKNKGSKKTADNAAMILSPQQGMKKRVIVVCGKEEIYKGNPCHFGLSFSLI